MPSNDIVIHYLSKKRDWLLSTGMTVSDVCSNYLSKRLLYALHRTPAQNNTIQIPHTHLCLSLTLSYATANALFVTSMSLNWLMWRPWLRRSIENLWHKTPCNVDNHVHDSAEAFQSLVRQRETVCHQKLRHTDTRIVLWLAVNRNIFR